MQRPSQTTSVPGQMPSPHRQRLVYLATLVVLGLLLFSPSLRELYGLSLAVERYSHTVLIPLISLYLLFHAREKLLQSPSYAPLVALPLFVVSAALAFGAIYFFAPPTRLPLSLLALVLFLAASFLMCFGRKSTTSARFPLLFLLLMVPLPAVVLDQVVTFLQMGSAEVSHLLFNLSGAPVLRQGLSFYLPGLHIEIARECSGIRSSIALGICTLLMAHLQLRSAWTKTALLLAIVPLVLIKNGIRIVTLSLLGVYVDRSFLSGMLHTQGGIVFFAIAMLLMLLLLGFLRGIERRGSSAAQDARLPIGNTRLTTAPEKA